MTDRPVILVVDDEPLVRTMLRHVLTTAGYDVAEAADAKEAVERLADRPVRAAIFDLYLAKGVNGLDLAAKVLGTRPFATLPIWFLSGEEHAEIAQRALALGARGFFPKSDFPIDRFLRALAAEVPPGPTTAGTQVGAGSRLRHSSPPAPTGVTAEGFGGQVRPRSPVSASAASDVVPPPAHRGPKPPPPPRGYGAPGAPPTRVEPPGREGHAPPLAARLQRLGDLRPLPAVAQELVQVTSGTGASRHAAAEVIRRDHALAAKVLKIANSSFFGGKERIYSVDRAVVQVGLNGLRELALGVVVSERMRRTRGASAYPAREAWEHSMAVALAARSLARDAGHADPERVFVAGLLHDIGKDVLDELVTKEFDAILKQAAAGGLLPHLERCAFGCDHADVGRRALEHWMIPSPLPETIALHHRPWEGLLALDTAARAPAVLVRLANAVAKAARAGDSFMEAHETVPDAALDVVGLPAPALSAAAALLYEQMNELRAILLMNDPGMAAPADPLRGVATGLKAWVSAPGAADGHLASVLLRSLGFEVLPDATPGAGSAVALGVEIPPADLGPFLAAAAAGGVARVVVLSSRPADIPPPAVAPVTCLRLPAPVHAVAAACVPPQEAGPP